MSPAIGVLASASPQLSHTLFGEGYDVLQGKSPASVALSQKVEPAASRPSTAGGSAARPWPVADTAVRGCVTLKPVGLAPWKGPAIAPVARYVCAQVEKFCLQAEPVGKPCL